MDAPPARAPLRRAVAVALGLGLIAAVELGLRAAGVAPDATWTPPKLALVVRDGEVQGTVLATSAAHFETALTAAGETEIHTAAAVRLGEGVGYPFGGSMRALRFTPVPAPGVARWGVLGGSSALGLNPSGPAPRTGGPQVRFERLPNGAVAFPEALSLSGQLRAGLEGAGRAVEVLNAGMIAQDASVSRRIGEELLAFGASGLVAFDGNNESIGLAVAMADVEVPPTRAEVGLRRTRIYRVLTEHVAPLRAWGMRRAPVPQETRDPLMLGRIVEAQWRTAGRPLVEDGPDGPTPTDTVHAALRARYRTSLRGLVESARAAGAVVVAAPTPPNLAHAPFSPAHGPSVSASGAARHASACAKARAALDAGDVATAMETARAAVAIDPAHALGHWLLGTALGRAGEPEAALAALVRAHALDTAHKRSLRGYVREAEEVCRELGCVAVDIDAALRERARAEGPAVYGEVFGDHEHLTVAGNRWVGERIVGAILAAR